MINRYENGGYDDSDKQLKTCAVLGGRGFVGRALVERLLRLGNWIVRVADYSESPELAESESILADAFASGRAAYFCVDVRNKTQIVKAVEGVSVVFYIDSLDSFPHDFLFCYRVIVQGAKNVVTACRECRVKRLIYNSSADIFLDNDNDTTNGDESLQYAGQFKDMVTDLRAQAEALILFANDIDNLLTCVLRPCNVFGPGDKQLIPSLINMAKSGWAKFLIGSGDHPADFTYVDNVAHAHICAEESLSSRMISVGGKIFLISNMEPMGFWEFASLILEGLGYERPVISLPSWVSRCLIFLVKLIHVKSGSGNLDPCVSVYNVAALALRTRTISCSAASKHLQYSPVVPMQEAVASTVASFSHLARDSPSLINNDSDEPSKVDKLLGSGKVADILLWRDEKKTFLCFLLLSLLYYWFFFSGRTFVSSVANLLLLIAVLLCGHHVLPLSIFGFQIPRLSSSCFEVSEVDMRNSLLTVTSMWNELGRLTMTLAQGEQWSSFLKVTAFLYFCKLIIPNSLTAAIGLAFVLAFTLCLVYEQHEEEIDSISGAVLSNSRNALTFCLRNLPMQLGSPSSDSKKKSE